MVGKTMQDEREMALGERIRGDLRKKMENQEFALKKILPLLAGRKVCDATEVLYFAINEIQNNSVVV